MNKNIRLFLLPALLIAIVAILSGCGGDTVYITEPASDPTDFPNADFSSIEGTWVLKDLSTVYMEPTETGI